MSSTDTPLTAFLEIVSARGDAPAIIHGRDVFSFAGIDRMSRRMADDFLREGAARQTGILLAVPNSVQVAAAVLAAWRIGAFPVFVSPMAPAGHVARGRDLTQAAVVLGDAPPLSADPVTGTPEPVTEDETGSVVFTSGSTGAPKGVMQTAANLLSGARRVGRLNGYAATERILCPVPFSHDYGWGQLLSCLCLGITLVLPATEGVQAMADAIAVHRPTFIAGTPAVYAGMVYGISDIRKQDTGSVRKGSSTGAHLPPELVAGLQDLFPGIAIYANYGLTETYRSACLLPSERTGREASVGRAIEGVTLLVVDDRGQPLPSGQEGEIVHAGAGVCAGYVNDPERTAQARRMVMLEGRETPAIFTGDIGRLDADGYLTLTGRRDRLIKTMDVRVSLDEVEKTLGAAGLTERVAAVDLPDRILGRRIVAYVIPRAGVDAARIRQEARARLSKYQLPRTFHAVASLPMTPSGKIDYLSLRKMAEGHG